MANSITDPSLFPRATCSLASRPVFTTPAPVTVRLVTGGGIDAAPQTEGVETPSTRRNNSWTWIYIFFYSLLFSVLFTWRIMNKDSMRVGSAEDSFLRLENSDLIKTLLTVSADSCNCIGLLSFLRMLNCSLNTCDSKRNKNKLNKFTYFWIQAHCVSLVTDYGSTNEYIELVQKIIRFLSKA